MEASKRKYSAQDYLSAASKHRRVSSVNVALFENAFATYQATPPAQVLKSLSAETGEDVEAWFKRRKQKERQASAIKANEMNIEALSQLYRHYYHSVPDAEVMEGYGSPDLLASVFCQDITVSGNQMINLQDLVFEQSSPVVSSLVAKIYTLQARLLHALVSLDAEQRDNAKISAKVTQLEYANKTMQDDLRGVQQNLFDALAERDTAKDQLLQYWHVVQKCMSMSDSSDIYREHGISLTEFDKSSPSKQFTTFVGNSRSSSRAASEAPQPRFLHVEEHARYLVEQQMNNPSQIFDLAGQLCDSNSSSACSPTAYAGFALPPTSHAFCDTDDALNMLFPH